MTLNKLTKHMRILGISLTLSIFITAGFLGYQGWQDQQRVSHAWPTVFVHLGALKSHIQTLHFFNDDTTLTALSDTLKSLEDTLQSTPLQNAVHISTHALETLENTKGKIQALILNDAGSWAQNIDKDFIKLIQSHDTHGTPQQMIDLLSARYGYNLSRHHVSTFSEGFQLSALERSQNMAQEARTTLNTYRQSLEAGKINALTKRIDKNLIQYQTVLAETLQAYKKMQAEINALESALAALEAHGRLYYDTLQQDAKINFEEGALAMILLGIFTAIALSRFNTYSRQYIAKVQILRRKPQAAPSAIPATLTMTRPEDIPMPPEAPTPLSVSETLPPLSPPTPISVPATISSLTPTPIIAEPAPRLVPPPRSTLGQRPSVHIMPKDTPEDMIEALQSVLQKEYLENGMPKEPGKNWAMLGFGLTNMIKQANAERKIT